MYIVIERKSRGAPNFYGPFDSLASACRYQADLSWLNEGTTIKTEVERLQKPIIFQRKTAQLETQPY